MRIQELKQTKHMFEGCHLSDIMGRAKIAKIKCLENIPVIQHLRKTVTIFVNVGHFELYKLYISSGTYFWYYRNFEKNEKNHMLHFLFQI